MKKLAWMNMEKLFSKSITIDSNDTKFSTGVVQFLRTTSYFGKKLVRKAKGNQTLIFDKSYP